MKEIKFYTSGIYHILLVVKIWRCALIYLILVASVINKI